MNIISIVPTREVQRNYRQLVNRVKRTKQPVFLGTRGQLEAVLMDGAQYLRETQPKASAFNADEFLTAVRKLRAKGKQNISLVKYLRHERDTRQGGR